MRERDASDFLLEALSELAVDVRPVSPKDYADLLVVTPGGGEMLLEIKRLSSVTSETVSGLTGRQQPVGSNREHLRFLVADRITSDAREQLSELGWGWLDLRGHLYLSADGILLNTDVDGVWERPARSDPLAGQAGLEVACFLLASPSEDMSLRAIARSLARSPSTVSEIVKALREEGLIENDRSVQHRDLFWRVADRWPTSRIPLAKAPRLGALETGRGSVDEVLGLGMAAPSSVGWALTDTLAAAAYGAPVAARADHPPDFFVPSETTIQRARTLLGVAPVGAGPQATVRVAPVPDVCLHRVDAALWSDEHWPLAAPLYVALDLAQDPGRGREVLESWDPAESGLVAKSDALTARGWSRVW